MELADSTELVRRDGEALELGRGSTECGCQRCDRGLQPTGDPST